MRTRQALSGCLVGAGLWLTSVFCFAACGVGNTGGSQRGEGVTLRSDSQKPDYHAQAARALAPFVGKDWEKIANAAASIPKAADYKTAAEEYVKSDEIQDKLAAGKPGIIYLYTTANIKVGAKEMIPPETEASTALMRSLVEGDGRDYHLPAAARFCKRILADITAVEKGQTVFCSANAPIVILVDNDGKVAQTLAGPKECTAQKVYAALLPLLKACGLSEKAVDVVAKKMKELFMAQMQAEQAKGSNAPETQVQRCEKRAAALQEEVGKLAEEMEGKKKKKEK